jgi:cell volume regulation protein A
MEPNATGVLLAAMGVVLLMTSLVVPVSNRLGVPLLLAFLLVGIAAGSEGLGGIPFEDYGLAFRLGTIALVLILFDGGLNTSTKVVRKVLAPAVSLATIGVLLTAAAIAGGAVLLGFSPAFALLIGSVVSSTDAAAVFAVLRTSRIRLRAHTGATLEVESGLNDPMAFILTILATEIALGHDVSWESAALVAWELAGGAGLGVGFGLLGRRILRLVSLPASGLYPVLTIAIAFTTFGIATLVHTSGFLAVYLAGVVLTSGPLPYRGGLRRVHDAVAWLAQTSMFVLLGLLVFPSRLWTLAPAGIALALALAFVARPVATLIALAPFSFAWREGVFIGWVGLRGAVPIILATYPVLRGVPHAELLFHLVFFVTIVNSLVPGMTVPWVARRLRLADPEPPAPSASIELVMLRESPGDFVWYRVGRSSAVAGAAVHELPLPDGCVLTILLRGDDVLAMRGDLRLAVGDHVCAFVLGEDRRLLDLLFGAAEDGEP